MRRSNERQNQHANQRGRGRAQGSVVPTSVRHRRPAAETLLVKAAISPRTSFGHQNNRRASEGPSFRPAFRPLSETQDCCLKATRRTTPQEIPMIANSLIITITILLALGFWLMGQLKFLIPYRPILLHQYGGIILLWITVLFVNVFAAVYVIQRKFFLKDTGRKLSHMDKQAVTGHSSMPSPYHNEESH
jgi:hypothetical protein